MSGHDDHLLEEFLVDGYESLDLLGQDLVELEHDPSSKTRLARAFRRLHTIKGTCPFFGFTRLERLVHAGESLLARLRDGHIAFGPVRATALLAVIDSARTILAGIEVRRVEPEGDDHELVQQLIVLQEGGREDDLAAAAGMNLSNARETAEVRDTELQGRHVRLDVRLLDHLVNLVGELVLARNQLLRTVEGQDLASAAVATQRVDHVTSRLQEEIMRTRMQPVTALFQRLPRLVRETASACGRQVSLELEGNATELDKTVVDALKDPLTHLVRNAVDHGIEEPAERVKNGKPAEGRLRLRAWQQGGSVHLELSDDGAGLSVERIRARALERGLISPEEATNLTDQDWYPFIFRAGFSTAQRVTSISGRGVGMEVVEAAVRGVGGRIELESTPGHGTSVHITIPLTLAIMPALTVEDGGERYAIPQAHLEEVVRPGDGELRDRIEKIQDLYMFRLRGQLLPVSYLGSRLRGAGAMECVSPSQRLVVLRTDEGRFGLVVDALLDTEEIVVKPLSRRMRNIPYFAGAAVRGDGRVALILDVPSLAQGLARQAAEKTHKEELPLPEGTTRRRMVLVRVRPGRTAAIPVDGVQRIAKFPAQSFEHRGEFDLACDDVGALPVVTLASATTHDEWNPFAEERDCPVLVTEHHGQRWGYVIDAVEDIVIVEHTDGEDCALIGERITEVLDLDRIARGRYAGAA